MSLAVELCNCSVIRLCILIRIKAISCAFPIYFLFYGKCILIVRSVVISVNLNGISRTSVNQSFIAGVQKKCHKYFKIDFPFAAVNHKQNLHN